MLGSIAAKLAFKTAGAAGSALAGAAGAVVKTGQAFGMAGKAIAGAAQNSSKQPQQSSNNVIVGNFGMAGSAGKQKVIGGGTLPAPKAVAKPQSSTKMPTEALLDTAVKYLTSIDKSLKSQLEFERRSYQEQARAEREAIIENKPSVTFSDIKDRLSGFKSDVKDNVSTAGTLLKYAAILGGAAALIASALDQKELNALKENVEQFKKQFGWLGDLAAMIPAGGIAGFLFGGKGLKGRLRGGVVGILAEAVAMTIFNRMSGKDNGDNTALNLAAAGGIGYFGYKSIKSLRGLSALRGGGAAAAGMAAEAGGALKTVAGLTEKEMGAYKMARQSGLSPKKARNFARVSNPRGSFKNLTEAEKLIKSGRWKKFTTWLVKKGRTKLVQKIEQRIAIALASGAVAATGIGSVFGAIGILVDIGFSLYLMYEIYQLWQQFTSDEKAEKAGVGDAQIEKELKTPDATKLTGNASTGAASAGQIPVSNQAILETIRMKESGNDYGAQNPESTASGAYQFIDGTWKALTNKYGIGTEYSKAKYAPNAIQDAVADKYVSEILQQAGGDVSKVPVAWYTGNIRGISTHATPQQVAAYQADWLRVYNGGKPDVAAATNTSTISGAMGAAAGASLEGMANLFGRLGSSIIKPGVARNFTPAGSNPSEQINNESMKLQNDITFGIKKEKSKDKISMPTIPAGTPRGVSPVKSVSNIDPNYQNINVVTKYLAHFRMAQ